MWRRLDGVKAVHRSYCFSKKKSVSRWTPDCTSLFPYCYDDHDGTDFMLIDGFGMMDMGSADVVAAADGVVISVHDGEYDRCHTDLVTQDVSCDGYPMIGNHVKIEHADGMETWYWHFKKDSIIVKEGDEVTCGDVLGKIGSSGYSSGPHLHFEVRVPNDQGGTEWIDPYAGLNSQEESYWVMQRHPKKVLPGCFCEGDEIPDFSDHDGDNESFSDVIVTSDVYEDVVGEVWPDVDLDAISDTLFDCGDTPWCETSPDLRDEAWESEFGNQELGRESVDFDTAVSADSSTDASSSVDSGNGGRDDADSAGGCSSTGGAGASNGLMLLFGAGILAMFLRRRRAFH